MPEAARLCARRGSDVRGRGEEILSGECESFELAERGVLVLHIDVHVGIHADELAQEAGPVLDDVPSPNATKRHAGSVGQTLQ